MCGIARRNDFPWDAILGAEIAGDYKPKPVRLSARPPRPSTASRTNA